MKTDFDFDRIGKRMPYKVPEGSLEELEEKILREVSAGTGTAKAKRNVCYLHLFLKATASIAAVIALVLILHKNVESGKVDEYEEIEIAFNSLSSEDQDYFLSTYEDDVFMNEQ